MENHFPYAAAVHLVLYLDSQRESAVCYLYCRSKYYQSNSEASLEICQMFMIELLENS